MFWRGETLVIERREIIAGRVVVDRRPSRRVSDAHGSRSGPMQRHLAAAYPFEPVTGPARPLYAAMFDVGGLIARVEVTRAEVDALARRWIEAHGATSLRLPLRLSDARVSLTARVLDAWTYDPVRHLLVPRHGDGEYYAYVDVPTLAPKLKRNSPDFHPDFRPTVPSIGRPSADPKLTETIYRDAQTLLASGDVRSLRDAVINHPKSPDDEFGKESLYRRVLRLRQKVGRN